MLAQVVDVGVVDTDFVVALRVRTSCVAKNIMFFLLLLHQRLPAGDIVVHCDITHFMWLGCAFVCVLNST